MKLLRLLCPFLNNFQTYNKFISRVLVFKKSWLENVVIDLYLLLKKDFNRTILFFLGGARNEAYNLYVSDVQQTKKPKEAIG